MNGQIGNTQASYTEVRLLMYNQIDCTVWKHKLVQNLNCFVFSFVYFGFEVADQDSLTTPL